MGPSLIENLAIGINKKRLFFSKKNQYMYRSTFRFSEISTDVAIVIKNVNRKQAFGEDWLVSVKI